MQPAIVHSWFRPTISLVLDGVPWATVSGFGLAMPAPACAKPKAEAEAIMAAYVRGVAPEPISFERKDGFCILETWHFAGYAIDMIEAAYPGATWHVSAIRDAMTYVIARLGGVPVGIVLNMRRDDGEPCKPPDCIECEGHGGPACKECDGAGNVECSECGHDKECDECDGEGTVGTCKVCNGSRAWVSP